DRGEQPPGQVLDELDRAVQRRLDGRAESHLAMLSTKAGRLAADHVEPGRRAAELPDHLQHRDRVHAVAIGDRRSAEVLQLLQVRLDHEALAWLSPARTRV